MYTGPLPESDQPQDMNADPQPDVQAFKRAAALLRLKFEQAQARFHLEKPIQRASSVKVLFSDTIDEFAQLVGPQAARQILQTKLHSMAEEEVKG